MVLIEGLEGSGKAAVSHKRPPASSRTTHATTMHQTRSLRITAPLTPAPDKAHHAAIDQLLRDPLSRLVQNDKYGIGKVCIWESVQVPLLIAQARKSDTVRRIPNTDRTKRGGCTNPRSRKMRQVIEVTYIVALEFKAGAGLTKCRGSPSFWIP
jgi:hypothetical protein